MNAKQEHTYIRVRGAREHNLKSVNVDIPRGKLSVITGVSGSGKSSLAFDTIYAEGQRRYVESLSAYARQFLDTARKPDVDSIEGLSPAISIEQKSGSRNPRSTVGTVTEIHDYLRVLFARAGVPHSPATGKPIVRMSVGSMVDDVLAMPPGRRLHLLAPLVSERKGAFRKELLHLRKRGFQRVLIDEQLHELHEIPELDRKRKHTIEVVVDRIVVQEDIKSRLADSFERALELSDGLACVEEASAKTAASAADTASASTSAGKKKLRRLFSSKFACPETGFALAEIEPRLFSFNAPQGACPGCDGLGETLFVDPALVVPNTKRSLSEMPIAPWARSSPPSPYYRQILHAIAEHYQVDVTTSWENLPTNVVDCILHGSGKTPIAFVFSVKSRRHRVKKPFEGVINHLMRRWRETDSNWIREDLMRYQSRQPCNECRGYRLKPEALCVKLDSLHIGEVSAKTIREALFWIEALPSRLTNKQRTIAESVVREIRERLRFLCDVGLDYLTLARASASLSGGEAQRIRLASQIGSGLTGVLYVLDEPSIGLHQRDNARLLATLERLRDLGNTVVVVEHDEETIRTADNIVDMGPGAGLHGGEVVAVGTTQDLIAEKRSLTGRYLSGAARIGKMEAHPPGNRWLQLRGARLHNLQNVSVDIPLGSFVCVTGVSGSGKSSLIMETLYRALERRLGLGNKLPGPFDSLEGYKDLEKIVHIDQSPIGRTPRSNPATYTGVFTPIREWFSGLPEARARGYKPGRFSFNVAGGRCEACRGDGVMKVEMHFLPDVYVRCDTCRGRRYNRETLEVLFRGRSIADILDLSVHEACALFHAVPAIRTRLQVLGQVGMGYVKTGQAATTLSGGEAQRIKLARELSRRSSGRSLYILDEPTTGLHFDDVRKLLNVLHALVEQENTVIVIEHNLEVVKTADWILDLGPEGGAGGGRLLAQGPPAHIVRKSEGYTSEYLKPLLEALGGSPTQKTESLAQ